MIFERKHNHLKLNTLDMQILFDDLFDTAENEREVEWIFENLQSAIEFARDEKIEQMEANK